MKRLFQSNWKWGLILLILAVVYVLWGGITLTIRNQSAYDICEIHYSTNPIETEGGVSIFMLNAIHARQSRDFNLPVFLTWFRGANEDMLFVRSVGCNGEIMDYWEQDISEGNYFMREVR